MLFQVQLTFLNKIKFYSNIKGNVGSTIILNIFCDSQSPFNTSIYQLIWTSATSLARVYIQFFQPTISLPTISFCIISVVSKNNSGNVKLGVGYSIKKGYIPGYLHLIAFLLNKIFVMKKEVLHVFSLFFKTFFS